MGSFLLGSMCSTTAVVIVNIKMALITKYDAAYLLSLWS
jgi:hypothetical protein